jgi:hypothetical protein
MPDSTSANNHGLADLLDLVSSTSSGGFGVTGVDAINTAVQSQLIDEKHTVVNQLGTVDQDKSLWVLRAITGEALRSSMSTSYTSS